MSKVVRSVKNVTKGYSSVQVKVRNGKSALSSNAGSGIIGLFCDHGVVSSRLISTSPITGAEPPASCVFPILGSHANDAICLATSNDPWGPTGTDMSEIAAMTFGR